MEVIRENFDSLYPEIRDAIQNCSFMAIDTELTGLRVNEERDNYFDTMEERYQVIRETSNKYLIIQFGLVTFFYDEESDTFTHKAYNFYTYPSQTKNFMPTVRFMCESSSIEFLSSFGFDFNKLFHHGIAYLSSSMVKKVIEEHEEREAKYENEKASMTVPENFKKFMEDSKSVIKRFLASNKKEYVFDTLSPFQRRLMFENFKPQYPNLLFETVQNDEEESDPFSASESDDDTKTPGRSSSKKKDVPSPVLSSSVKTADESALPKSMADLSLPTQVKQKQYKKPLRITKVSEEELEFRKNQKKQKFEKDIDSMIGFSKVIHEIGKSGKIVVGHNMLLDVSHAINQFVDDLPETLAEFKNCVQTALPNLVDTKLMACQLPFRELFKSSVLSDVIKRLETEPFTFEDSKLHSGIESKGYEFGQSKFHEAGYDAYITGLCFISMCKYLGTLQSPKKPRVLPESPLVMPYINKLYLMRMMDVCYMNISGIDLTPSRSHVFYVQCPKNTSIDMIRSWFSPFGQIQYHWQRDDIFVSLMDKDQAPLVMRNLEHREGYFITPFEDYTKRREEKLKLSQAKNQQSSTNSTHIDPSPPSSAPAQTKRPKTESTEVKRKPATKATQLFEQPAWD